MFPLSLLADSVPPPVLLACSCVFSFLQKRTFFLEMRFGFFAKDLSFQSFVSFPPFQTSVPLTATPSGPTPVKFPEGKFLSFLFGA